MRLFKTLSLTSLVAVRALAVGSPFRALATRGGASGHVRFGSTMSMPEPTEDPIKLADVAVVPSDAAPSAWSGDILVLPFWEVDQNETLAMSEQIQALDSDVGGALTDLIADHEFSGKGGSSAVATLPRGSAARRVCVVGLGKADKWKTSGARKFGATLASLSKDQKAKVIGTVLPSEPAISPPMLQATVEAALLGASPDTRYKSKPDDDANKPPPLQTLELIGSTSDKAEDAIATAAARARTVAAGVLLTKGLVGSPPNYLNPGTMADTAAALAEALPSLSLKVLERADCEALGMGAYLAVAQGSLFPPKFIHLTYTPPGGASKKVCLVGKGLTFDSGGYNIKAGAGSMIEKMKFDMGGAGAVLGAARAVGELAPKGVEVHFIIAACENMVSAEAYRPGDILTASNKKTIEVLNTDAEGRLTLADALVYADRLGDVDVIVDIATLTGACIVALGPDYGAMYTDSDDLLARLSAAAEAGGELLWRMPLAPEYVEGIKSPLADIANLGAPGGGGSITAALFLKEFVGETSTKADWAHLDIAGPVWNDKQGGATGYGVRTLVGLVESMSPEQ